MLVRTWNLFHGNTTPPGRHAHLDEMVRRASADGPDVLCLQEVPAWAATQLGEWSGMRAFADVAARPRIGPLPSTARIGHALTSLHHGVLRSAFSGQANAILVSPRIRVLDRHAIVLNTRRFRDAQARWLGLDVWARLAWANERRVCQAVRLALPDGRRALVANLHATSYWPDHRLADAELLRAATWAEALARPEDVVVLAGDMNARPERSRTLPALADEWGFSPAVTGIDHVLVRGAAASEPDRWAPERRLLPDGRLLSDHTPVEVTVA